MSRYFKVGDKVTNDGSDNVGEILFLYIDGLIDAALVQWPNTVNSWPVSRLTKYQEPLKYGSGEEVKVGDLVWHRSVAKGIAVLVTGILSCKRIEVLTLEQDPMKTTFMEMSKMSLIRRRTT